MIVLIPSGKILESNWEFAKMCAKESSNGSYAFQRSASSFSAQNGCLLKQEQEISLVHGGQCSKLSESVNSLK